MSKIETARDRSRHLATIATNIGLDLELYMNQIEPTDHLFNKIEEAITAVSAVREEVRRLRDEKG